MKAEVWPRLLSGYLKKLADARNYRDYEWAVVGIDRTRKALSASEAYRFSQLLLRAPDLAAPYFYYRLYLCNDKPGDLANLLRLANIIAARHPEASLPPLVRVRLAEVYYRRNQYRKALRWAESAMRPRPFDRALYVRGVARHKLRNYRGAIADFSMMLSRFPKSPLKRGAKENLAILYEAIGNTGNALEQYFSLGYRADIAFLLDARMTPGEIQTFLARRPRHPQRDLVRYSLGIRYMRAGDLNHAEYLLRHLPLRKVKAFAIGRGIDNDRITDVRQALRDPLVTLRDLRRLNTAIGQTRTSNARAEAMYVLASYYYKKRNLLFYNSMLWQGYRAYSFDFWWNSDHATRKDDIAARRHMYQHECLNRTRELCLKIAAKYPYTSAAPKALYRAACAGYYLANLNAWWGRESERHSFRSEAISLMRQIVRHYPKHPLAKPARKYAEAFAEEGHYTSWGIRQKIGEE